MTAGEARDAGTQTGSGGAPPADAEALVEEINRTREELGDTVQALAAKADVKARAQQRAAEVSGQLKGRLDGVKEQLASRTSQLTGKAAGTGQSVAGRGRTVLGAGQSAGMSAWAATPEPVQRRARQVARTVDQNRGPAIAIAGVTLVGAWLAIRWLRR
jgi:hypothetical protein